MDRFGWVRGERPGARRGRVEGRECGGEWNEGVVKGGGVIV
jgi:hypothetical protein